jgi:chitinase
MAFTRCPCRLLQALVLLSLLAVGSLAAGPGNIAVFWGQNKDEGTLRETCDTGTYTITIPISFLHYFGHSKYSLDLSDHPLAGIVFKVGGRRRRVPGEHLPRRLPTK